MLAQKRSNAGGVQDEQAACGGGNATRIVDGVPGLAGTADRSGDQPELSKSVIVEELATPDVPRLQVTNVSSTPVLVLDGDLMVGGQQNRVAVGSHLIAAAATAVFEVGCVEQERWHGQRQHETGRERASAFVRGVDDQHEVWRRVHVERQEQGTVPEVDDLQPMPGQSGVLIAVGGRPVLLELFADEVLLAEAWPRILRAAARDASRQPSRGASGH